MKYTILAYSVLKIFFRERTIKLRLRYGLRYTPAFNRAVILDLTPQLHFHLFITSFRRFIARNGCPIIVISEGGKEFASDRLLTYNI